MGFSWVGGCIDERGMSLYRFETYRTYICIREQHRLPGYSTDSSGRSWNAFISRR